MTQEQIITLAKIYNTLMEVETKGNSTKIMAQCLNSLQTLVIELQKERKEQE